MMLKALIYEQLERDGTLRSLRMQPSLFDELIVAMPEEYDEQRIGAFHFLDEEDEQRFKDGFANCRVRKLGENSFMENDKHYKFRTNWNGIPTERGGLSYYALSLPEFCVLEKLKVLDPRRPGFEYRRDVTKDEQRNRFVVFLECSSSYGRFDFELECEFRFDTNDYYGSSYSDPVSNEYGSTGEDWKHCLNNRETKKVERFFVENLHIGDRYSAKTVGIMGNNASGSHINIDQEWNAHDLNLTQLADELALLRLELKSGAQNNEDERLLTNVVEAEKAARNGDKRTALKQLKGAGKWAFETATKIGTTVAATAIELAMGHQ